jgi:hypothetical protein
MGSPPVGTCMASSNTPPLGWVATAIVGHARPPDPGGSTEVEMSSPTMRPWEVLANQYNDIGPVTLVAALQLVPPLVEEMKPTFSWQLVAEQAAFG